MSHNTHNTPIFILDRLEELVYKRHTLLGIIKNLPPNCPPFIQRSYAKELKHITKQAQKITSDAMNYHTKQEVRSAILKGKDTATSG